MMMFPAILAAALGHASPIRVQAEATPATVTVGDRVAYRAVFRTPPGAVLTPAFGATQFWDWDVAALKALPPRDLGGGEIEQVFEAVLLPWSATATGTPALPFTLSLPKSDAHVLMVSPAAVKVESVLAKAKDAGEPKPLKGVIGYRSLWPWIAGALALLAAAAAWWWWRTRRRLAALAALPAAPRVPPERTAREALDALLASPLLAEGQVKAFYILLSDILRRYLEGKFGVPTLDRTTAEILPALRDAPGLRAHYGDLRAFLEDGDLVKFAKLVPDPDEIAADVARVRAFIAATERVGT